MNPKKRVPKAKTKSAAPTKDQLISALRPFARFGVAFEGCDPEDEFYAIASTSHDPIQLTYGDFLKAAKILEGA
jgi:hypothetical protein